MYLKAGGPWFFVIAENFLASPAVDLVEEM